MTATAPLELAREEERCAWGGTRLGRIMGVPNATPGTRSALIDHPPPAEIMGGELPPTLRFVDATAAMPPVQSAGTVAIQILWTAPGTRHAILAGRDPQEPGSLLAHPAHPGDTLLVPPNAPFALEAGSIGFIAGTHPLRDKSNQATVTPRNPPTHGMNLFYGYNRRTICIATPNLMVERWKLTSPLTLDIATNRPLYLVNLVAPMALQWRGGMTLLGRLESRAIPTGLHRITLVPDGLGYLLVASQPSDLPDTIQLLRAAGYANADLSAIGMPPPRSD